MNEPDHPLTGMCIPCEVRETPDKGRGVFVTAPVVKDTTVWRHMPGCYEVLDEKALEQLLAAGTDEDAVYLLTHIVTIEEYPDFMINVLDEGALINHGELGNVVRKHPAGSFACSPARSTGAVSVALLDQYFDLVAARNLVEGEELLMDYEAEPDDPEYYEEACRRFGVSWDFL